MKTKILLTAISLMSIISINASAQNYSSRNENYRVADNVRYENNVRDEYTPMDRRDEGRFHEDHDRYNEHRDMHEYMHEDRGRYEYSNNRGYRRDTRIIVNPLDVLIPGRRIIREILF